MSDKLYVLPGGENIIISSQAAQLLIKSGDGDAALLYIYILNNSGIYSASDAGRSLDWSSGRLSQAFSVLCSLGLVASGVVPKASKTADASESLLSEEKCPEYTAEDIAQAVDGGSDFGSLIKELQRRLGRITSPSEMTALFGMYDYLGLPSEVIVTLVSYCIEECHQKYGPSRMPTMKFIEKTAYSWANQGITTLEKAEEYIQKLEHRKSFYTELKQILNINDRNFTATELKYINSWIDMGYTPETLSIAYDKTVFRVGKMQWKYMDSIIRNWQSKGLMTADDIEKDDKRLSHCTAQSPSVKEGVRPQGPSEQEFKRMQQLLDKLNSQ